MGKVCVITGGGSGMGLAAAHEMGRRGFEVVISGRTVSKLDGAIAELEAEGIVAHARRCDVADRGCVEELAAQAAELGEVHVVLHAAGVAGGDPQTIMATNALGTVNVNDVFLPVMTPGGCLIDVASIAGHFLPQESVPTGLYPLARTDRAAFLREMMAVVRDAPSDQQEGMAYSLSKSFALWFARTDCRRFGARNLRIVAVAPGVVETPMIADSKEACDALVAASALRRPGTPEQLAYLFASIADARNGFLTGVEIVCDGGSLAVMAGGCAEPDTEEVLAAVGA